VRGQPKEALDGEFALRSSARHVAKCHSASIRCKSMFLRGHGGVSACYKRFSARIGDANLIKMVLMFSTTFRAAGI
jgi:protein-arginine kinase activator protein McsA